MKKILLSLSILSLGMAQAPQCEAEPLFVMESEPTTMSPMAKFTLFLGMLLAGYGCYTILSTWLNQKKDTPKAASPDKSQKSQSAIPRPPARSNAAAARAHRSVQQDQVEK